MRKMLGKCYTKQAMETNKYKAWKEKKKTIQFCKFNKRLYSCELSLNSVPFTIYFGLVRYELWVSIKHAEKLKFENEFLWKSERKRKNNIFRGDSFLSFHLKIIFNHFFRCFLCHVHSAKSEWPTIHLV